VKRGAGDGRQVPGGGRVFGWVGAVVHVRIEVQGCEVVFLTAGAQALEVDEPDLVILDEKILGLEIPVHEMPRAGAKAVRQLGEDRVFAQSGGVPAKEFHRPASHFKLCASGKNGSWRTLS